MEIRAVLATNLKRYRKAADLSHEELANCVGIDRTFVSSLERFVYAASIDLLDRVTKALDVEAADLLKNLETSAKTRSDG